MCRVTGVHTADVLMFVDESIRVDCTGSLARRFRTATTNIAQHIAWVRYTVMDLVFSQLAISEHRACRRRWCSVEELILTDSTCASVWVCTSKYVTTTSLLSSWLWRGLNPDHVCRVRFRFIFCGARPCNCRGIPSYRRIKCCIAV